MPLYCDRTLVHVLSAERIVWRIACQTKHTQTQLSKSLENTCLCICQYCFRAESAGNVFSVPGKVGGCPDTRTGVAVLIHTDPRTSFPSWGFELATSIYTELTISNLNGNTDLNKRGFFPCWPSTCVI